MALTKVRLAPPRQSVSLLTLSDWDVMLAVLAELPCLQRLAVEGGHVLAECTGRAAERYSALVQQRPELAFCDEEQGPTLDELFRH